MLIDRNYDLNMSYYDKLTLFSVIVIRDESCKIEQMTQLRHRMGAPFNVIQCIYKDTKLEMFLFEKQIKHHVKFIHFDVELNKY